MRPGPWSPRAGKSASTCPAMSSIVSLSSLKSLSLNGFRISMLTIGTASFRIAFSRWIRMSAFRWSPNTRSKAKSTMGQFPGSWSASSTPSLVSSILTSRRSLCIPCERILGAPWRDLPFGASLQSGPFSRLLARHAAGLALEPSTQVPVRPGRSSPVAARRASRYSGAIRRRSRNGLLSADRGWVISRGLSFPNSRLPRPLRIAPMENTGPRRRDT